MVKDPFNITFPSVFSGCKLIGLKKNRPQNNSLNLVKKNHHKSEKMLHTKKCLLFRTYIKAPSPYKSKASM
jgi:hypothetical protein